MYAYVYFMYVYFMYGYMYVCVYLHVNGGVVILNYYIVFACFYVRIFFNKLVLLTK